MSKFRCVECGQILNVVGKKDNCISPEERIAAYKDGVNDALKLKMCDVHEVRKLRRQIEELHKENERIRTAGQVVLVSEYKLKNMIRLLSPCKKCTEPYQGCHKKCIKHDDYISIVGHDYD
jgi:hypothetical protein